MSSILYYVTGHGFGHAVRAMQVMGALRLDAPELRIQVRTSAPQWLFDDAAATLHYSEATLDVGIVQTDSLAMRLDDTLSACQALYAAPQSLIAGELSFIKAHDIDLVVGDAPPLAFEIAAQAGVPSVAIANFTWDFIYQNYLAQYPGFAPVIDAIVQGYSKATLALTLPYPCGCAMFPRQEAIPWISRESRLSKLAARRRFGLPPAAPIVLLSFGGMGLDRLPWRRLAEQREYFFITTGGSRRLDGNLLTLPVRHNDYVDLLRAADAVVAKPGYGIVADVLANRLPLLYTDRGDFAEYQRLVQVLNECATADYVSNGELLAGNLRPHLDRLLARPPHWPEVDLTGARVAARKILALLPSAS